MAASYGCENGDQAQGENQPMEPLDGTERVLGLDFGSRRIRMYRPLRPASNVVIRACHAKRRSMPSKNASRSAGLFMRRTAGNRTVVTKPTPPIHRTTAMT